MSEIISILAQKIAVKNSEVADFFTKKFTQFSPLFYNSVDLRHSGFKIAPVDTNCYPAGFNNVLGESKKRAEKLIDDFFSSHFGQKKSEIKKVLIIPESHTRNQNYLENLVRLQELISVKYEVVIGSLIDDLKEKMVISLENGHSLTLHPLQKRSGKIFTYDGFEPDFIVLNNDLTGGIPEILQDISTPISPSPDLGWHSRTKSHHFAIYNKLAEEISQILEIDPWLISSLHRSCHDVDFKQPDKEVGGLKCLAKYVDELIGILREKYQKYGVNQEPYCYVKADNGTYGMAVWPVFSGAEVLEINKKERNKMNMIKGSVQNTQIMIQEGIRTIDKIDDKVAEPMIYMVNGDVAANLFRVNEARNEEISLNAAGAVFFDLENLSENQVKIGVKKSEVAVVYALVARLAALAAAMEKK